MERNEKTKYVYIEHPSDVGFEASGDTLEELFANAAIATYSFMTDVDEIEEEEEGEREIEIKSEDLYSLMFDWLDEMIFMFESESLVMKKFDISVNSTDFSITGTCRGGKFDPYKHDSGIIIKAVTYNMMEIKRNEIWHARVVLDV
ncbi:MAG: archease [Euryarchaeota archaeon]|nr:archease [Euryarchaeota archaeon]